MFKLLIAFFAINLNAFAYSQDITLNFKNASLYDVMSSITKQSGYSFTLPPANLKISKPVTVDIKSSDIEEILHAVFAGQPLEYKVEGKLVMVVGRNQKKSELIERSSILSLEKTINDSLITIQGKVTDEQGNPIPGATVMVSGTNLGATTSVEGTYRIDGVRRNARLIISNVAFLTRELNVSNRKVLPTLVLKPFIGTLDETVIVAYGTTTQRFNTSNLSVVKSEDIQKQPVNNPLLALTGRVPGLFISQSSGVSGTGVKIMLQGQNSISKGNEPFYVIDGVPYSSQLGATGISGMLYGYSGVTSSVSGNPLNYINPNDIESISVLKDADATAIYGSRAANGAIIITTKKGIAGELKFDLNVQKGVGEVTRKIKMLNNKEYLMMRNEALRNDGISIQSYDADINGVWDTTQNTNWQDELIDQTAQYTTINSSISGGTAFSQYLVGVSYNKETSLFSPKFFDQKGSLHFSLNAASLNKRFNFQLSASYLIDDNRLPGIDLTQISLQLAPTAPSLYNHDGTINFKYDSIAGFSTFFQNPAVNFYSKYRNNISNLVSSASLSYKVIKGLELKTNFGYTILRSTETSLAPLIAQIPENRPFSQRAALYGNGTIGSFLIEPQAIYKFDAPKNRLEFLIGCSIQQSYNTGSKVQGIGYNSDEVLEDIKAATTISVGSSVDSKYKYNAIFARLNYILNDRYILNLAARRDGSSRFGPENQFHNFLSAGGAWIFTEENFLKQAQSVLSFGKIKASYGTTGSDQIGDYQFLDNYVPYNVGVAYQGGSALISERLTNPYLQWEETRKFQTGLELGFFSDHLLIGASFFRNTSSNQLLDYNMPIMVGFGSIVRNFPAKVRNSGYEFNLSTTIIKTNNFSWSSSANLTIPKNEILAFPDLASSSYKNSFIIGEPINIRKVFNSAGVDPNSGLYQFYDNKGNITASPNPLLDKSKIVKLMPEFYGGIQNNFSFHKVELSFLFQFVKQLGQSFRYGDFSPGGYYINQPASVLDRWQKKGDVKSVQKFTTGFDAEASLAASNASESDLAFTNASFVRLKNFSISWNVPLESLKRYGLKNTKLFAQGQNLLTFTTYQGLDPENASIFNLPPLKVFVLGVQIGL